MSTQTLSEVQSGRPAQPPSARRSLDVPYWLKKLPFLAMHLACLGVFFVQATPLAFILCGVFYLVRMFGITAGYHRYFSHRSYKTSRWFQFVLAWLGCSALQNGPLWWTAHHRQHHRHSDTPQDPHSPRNNSFWWSHIGWVLARDYEDTNWPVVRDWSRYPELLWLNRYSWIPGLLLAVLCFVLDGWSGVVWGFFISTVLLYHAVFAVNSLCHVFGRRRYATGDQSRNNWFVALFTLGEGWHNNHHHYQSSTRQGFFWWEIDICYYLIKMLGWVRLVWDIRKCPPARLLATAVSTVPVPGSLALAEAGSQAEAPTGDQAESAA